MTLLALRMGAKLVKCCKVHENHSYWSFEEITCFCFSQVTYLHRGVQRLPR